MSTVEKRRLTPEEYLAIERQAEFRSEFYQGEMFAMAGASWRHNKISGNIFGHLFAQLQSSRCSATMNDMRICIEQSGLYTYPDVTVVCGEPRFLDNQLDTLLNPTLLVEVTSPSTETYDRGRKFDHYCRLQSLQQYVIVAQSRPTVIRYTRRPDGEWALKIFSSMADRVELTSIHCELTLEQIYDQVIFDPELPQTGLLGPDRN